MTNQEITVVHMPHVQFTDNRTKSRFVTFIGNNGFPSMTIETPPLSFDEFHSFARAVVTTTLTRGLKQFCGYSYPQ